MLCVCMFCCFFFKQKTAYELRISDWSSDVCSSDLLLLAARQRHALLLAALGEARKVLEEALDGPAVRLLDLRQLEILLHRQARDDAPVLRHQSDSDTRSLEGLHLMQRLVVEPDFVVRQMRLGEARVGAQCRGLAGDRER